MKFSEKENTIFFRAKKLMKTWYSLIMKVSCFELFRDGKYSLFLSQKVDGKIIFTGYWKVLVLNFSVMGNTVFFSAKKIMERWYLFGLFELSMIFQDLENMGFCAVFYDFVHFSMSLKDIKIVESCFHENHPDVFYYAGCCCYWHCCFIWLDISLLMVFNIIPHSFLSHLQFYPDGCWPILYFQPELLQRDLQHFHFNFLITFHCYVNVFVIFVALFLSLLYHDLLGIWKNCFVDRRF